MSAIKQVERLVLLSQPGMDNSDISRERLDYLRLV